MRPGRSWWRSRGEGQKIPYVTEEELRRERTPFELLSWVEDKLASFNDDGVRALRLRIGLMKPLVEEVYPMAVYACKKYGNTDLVKIRPAIGSQNYDAIVTDNSRSPASVSYLEVTQAHEGEERHLRNVYLNEHGFVPGHGPIKKAGTKKRGMSISADFKAESVPEMASRELGKVLSAVKRKERKEYPPDTSLIVWFDDVYTDRHHEILRQRKEAKSRTLQARKSYNNAARRQGSEN